MADDKDNEKDTLWELLGHAPKAEPSAFFTQKVLRKVQNAPQTPAINIPFPLAFGKSAWALAAIAMVAVALAISSLLAPAPSTTSTTHTLLTNTTTSPSSPAMDEEAAIDYLLIANLDEFLESEEKALWAEFTLN